MGYITLGVWIVLHKDQIILPLQVFPSPEYPDLQLQVYEPTVFLHAALSSQLWVLVLHSSKSKTKAIKNLILLF